jgi:serpin B
MGVLDWLRGRRTGEVAERAAPAERPASDEAAVVAATTGFAAALYGELAGEPEALFLSPSSIAAALAMTLAGARGETEAELAAALQLAVPPDRLHPAFGRMLEATRAAVGVELATANAIWAQDGYALRPEYLAIVRETYRAAIEQVDFERAADQARGRINAWVEEQTRGRIRDLVPPGVLGAITRLVLVNAVYFKGAWADPFDRGATSDQPFHRLDGSSAKLPTMRRTGAYDLVEDADAQTIEIPYGDGSLAMVVVLPRRRDGLPALERALDGPWIARRLAKLDDAAPREVEVHLPRFRVEASFDLGGALQRLGARRAFDRTRADFSGMTGDPDGLFVSAVLHRAFVDVNEEGTEAAAATAVAMALAGMAPTRLRPPVFRADHPFLFLIRDRRTKLVLFLGRLLDPSADRTAPT